MKTVKITVSGDETAKITVTESKRRTFFAWLLGRYVIPTVTVKREGEEK